MNDKIKNLWEQAAKRTDIMNEERYEHFAELLLRDCALQLNNVYRQGGGTYGEYILNHYNIKIK